MASIHLRNAGRRVFTPQLSLSRTARPASCLQTTSFRNARSARHFHGSTAGDDTNSEPTQIGWAKLDTFPRRHIGPTPDSTVDMLKTLDPPVGSLDDFVREVLPADILSAKDLKLDVDQVSDIGESESLNKLMSGLREIGGSGTQYIGAGYYSTIVPPVIQRNVLENPAWYTSYTPYQPEISQGRLESLLNFQTMVCDLTGLPISNASLLDEGTAAAEAMTLSMNSLPLARQKRAGKSFLVSHLCHPQTIEVLQSRAQGFGIKIKVGDVLAEDGKFVKEQGDDLVGVLAQYPDTEGGVFNFKALADQVHAQGALFSVATDLLALTLLKPPGEFGADIAFGNAQRLGVPLGFGGPHAAFFATSEKYKRKIPGRLVGVSKDRLGDRALRLALQTREQHIRREKATSNICTAQALLANMSSLYAVYHGPQGLKAIAERINAMTQYLQGELETAGFEVATGGKTKEGKVAFDTIVVKASSEIVEKLTAVCKDFKITLRQIEPTKVGISLGEATTFPELGRLISCFKTASGKPSEPASSETLPALAERIPSDLERTSSFLTHPVFNSYHSETEMLRYIHHLQSKDLSLVHSMIPLGSCTMKLNATTEMMPLSDPAVNNIHPFAPFNEAKAYLKMIYDLERNLSVITGMAGCSIQPNSGAQGEFAGLRVIKKFHEHNGDKARNICLIPVSAHGTNPASAAMAGMRVVTIKCDTVTGNLDIADLKAKCEKHKAELAAIMVTYPSTFGVFEPKIKEVCELVHENGGQVYMDGANMNAQIGLCSPGEIGADVCHLNLHKTFCIPHGGGGPGVGPIAVAKHLSPFLPGHEWITKVKSHSPETVSVQPETAISPISAAPFGSASILPISHLYINMMGGKGLTHATKITLLNANYILARLKPHYPILYTNEKGRCAHEFILDVRKFSKTAHIEAIDIAKRLQDYGFHAPTMSWPVANTLMIEPTESENKAELDRFCDALISIRGEIEAIEKGEQPQEKNVLKMAPHTQKDLIAGEWDRPYSRETAAYPLPYLYQRKFWPSVTRVDDGKPEYTDSNSRNKLTT